jgi:hypothetical protein
MEYNIDLPLSQQIKDLKHKNLTRSNVPNNEMHEHLIKEITNGTNTFDNIKQKYLSSGVKYYQYLDDTLRLDQKITYFNHLQFKYNQLLELFNNWEKLNSNIKNYRYWGNFGNYITNHHLFDDE